MYVIGVDGGGTKTTVALSNEKGEILSIKRGSSSNLRNVGAEKAVEIICDLIKEAKEDKEISSTYIALAAVEEEYKDKRDYLIEEIKKREVEGKIFIGSDQLASFYTGTDKKNGVGVICGTGAVAFGFNNGKKEKVSGWGYLGDEGSAFYVGIEIYRALQKSFDGRGEKTIFEDIVLREWGVKNGEDLNKKIYKDFMRVVPSLSLFIDEAGEKGDEVALSIIKRAGEELVVSVKTVIKKLDFKEEFPLVVSGGMFNSEILVDYFKKEINNSIKEAKIIVLKEDPVIGSVKLALEFL